MDENIIVKVNVAVVDTLEPYFIVVQDILGGANSLLHSLNESEFLLYPCCGPCDWKQWYYSPYEKY